MTTKNEDQDAVDSAMNAGIEDAEAGGGGSGIEGEGESAQSTGQLPDDIESLQAELEEARDQVIRAQAEIQNIRRRAEREVENANKYAVEKFSAALVPVVDNLERALELMSPDDEHTRPLAEGIELTQRSFLEVLKRFGIEVVDPAGEPFDPACHEAMSMIENNEVEPNTVLQVIQKGYTLRGRVLRAAMVMVSRPQTQVDESA